MVKAGYKQTEIGIIPEDWDVKSIGDVCQIFGRIGFRGYTVNDIVSEEQGVITISPSNIINNKTTFKKCTYLSQFKYEESPEIKIFNGDILLVKTGSTVGKTAIVKDLKREATINPQIVVLKKIIINNFYLGYLTAYKDFQNNIIRTIVGGAIPTLSQKQIASYKIPIPPKEEQKAIASALSDVDALITSLEKLIAKKESIKTATMQQLLIGKKRLNGFNGEWEEKRLGNIANISRGASPRPIEDPRWFNENSQVGWVRISDVSKTTKYLYETVQKLSTEGIAKSRFIKNNSLIMSICATLGKPILTKHDTCIHDGFVVFNHLTIEQEYLYYYLLFIENNWIKSGQSGSQTNLNTELINTTFIKLPPTIKEQQAIAQILTDMDNEIEVLKTKLSKTKAIKDGMMSELLTGKTRLKV